VRVPYSERGRKGGERGNSFYSNRPWEKIGKGGKREDNLRSNRASPKRQEEIGGVEGEGQVGGGVLQFEGRRGGSFGLSHFAERKKDA